ncbi:MAG: hypothetical protein II254_04680, partial [Oscillospiraceae bacterium]|nr:hypothetical protein [Oscillospiraceae bacterium]
MSVCKKIRKIKVCSSPKPSPCESPKMFFDQWFEIWLNDYKKLRVKTGTFETYRQYYKSLVLPVFGKTRLCDVRCGEIQRFFNGLAEKG